MGCHKAQNIQYVVANDAPPFHFIYYYELLGLYTTGIVLFIQNAAEMLVTYELL